MVGEALAPLRMRRLVGRFSSTPMAVLAAGLACAGMIGVSAVATARTPVHPWNDPGCPCSSVLRTGAPTASGLSAAQLAKIDTTVKAALARRATPSAVVLVARRGVIALWKAYGYAALYRTADYEPLRKPVRATRDTLYDIASITKLFTATAIMQLWDAGKVDLDAPVATYLPEFATPSKRDITVRDLLTHASGLLPDPPVPLFAIDGSRAARLQHALSLDSESKPGEKYIYSDINFIALGAIIERVTGESEAAYVYRHIALPLGMTSTLYNPPANLKPRIAASEYESWMGRGLLWGTVDDGNAWALGGVAGHAGIFSDAHDLAVFGQMVLNGGTYAGKRILSKHALELMETNWDARFPGDGTGLGWSIDRGYLMGALSGPRTIGHEGFTGTMLTVDIPNQLVTVILTNRVHPTRNGPSIIPTLRAINSDVADAIPVIAPKGGTSWYSGDGTSIRRVLAADIAAAGGGELSFDTWYRTLPSAAYGAVQISADGQHWQTIKRFSGSSGGWKREGCEIPAGTKRLRFVYTADYLYHQGIIVGGRGWYLHGVALRGVSLDAALKAQAGWARRSD